MTNKNVVQLIDWWWLNYLFSLLLCSSFLQYGEPAGTLAWGYAVTVWFTYALVYLLPAIVLSDLLYRLLYHRQPVVYWLIVVILFGVSYIVLFADSRLYELFGFHINSFVINLITTPGGIESLGSSYEAEQVFILIGAGLLLIPALLLFFAKMLGNRRLFRSGSGLRWFIPLFVLLTVGERFAYGFSEFLHYNPVMKVANAFPLYHRVRMRSLSRWIGLENKRPEIIRTDLAKGNLNYPQHQLQLKKIEKPLNLVWLVAESLRWDMLTPEIMPNTWQFAAQSLRLDQNMSGGNGTRQGLFALMYGLYGYYWDTFLRENQGPVLLNLLKQRNYQFYMTTSASFTYPEFDRTLFAAIDASNLHHANNHHSPWKRDEENAQAVRQFIRERDPSRPFMSFFFLESTHARYDFPQSAIIRSPYLGDVNYALMSKHRLQNKIAQLKNRYINASHHVDVQIGKILKTLRQQDLLKNTIVVITGDHGEEFMEKGHWGHNAGFHDEQIHTPMVLYIPEQLPGIVKHLTSHLDIVPTILPLLGVTNPVDDYAQGYSIFDTQRPNYLVASDWSGIAYINDSYKFYVPYRGLAGRQNALTTRNDQLVDDSSAFYKNHMPIIGKILKGARSFISNK
ncbi:MAG TPA: DUF3413 domain-containing protein [Crenotrichaceae bacterium]|nr:DUF3413 domain-containing protein [Crenotrichaceae bacterium]